MQWKHYVPCRPRLWKQKAHEYQQLIPQGLYRVLQVPVVSEHHSKSLCWLSTVSPVAPAFMVDAVMVYHGSWRKPNSNAQDDQKHHPACS